MGTTWLTALTFALVLVIAVALAVYFHAWYLLLLPIGPMTVAVVGRILQKR